jgi:hypothetical protein
MSGADGETDIEIQIDELALGGMGHAQAQETTAAIQRALRALFERPGADTAAASSSPGALTTAIHGAIGGRGEGRGRP